MKRLIMLILFLSLVGLVVAPAAPQQIKGAVVSVLGVWGGDELAKFTEVMKNFEKKTGAHVVFEGTRDLNAVLTTRIQGRNPPDIAILPNPGMMQELARAGNLIPLDKFMNMDTIKKDYSKAWIDLGTVDGKFYAIFYKAANKGTVWYNPKQFKANGWSVPKTWDEMISLSDKIVAAGKTPWSVGVESGAASGWPATDWVEMILLNESGPEVYDKWVAHKIPWTDRAVKSAWERFGKIVHTKGYVLGGPTAVLATNFFDASLPLFQSPPRAYMFYLGSFTQGFIASKFPNLKAGEDYSFFPFPTINARYKGAITGGADVVVMLRDTPASRAFMSYLASAEAQEIWVKLGGFTAVNRNVSLNAYPDPLASLAAKQLTEAAIYRFDGSDLMPPAVNDAFWKGTLDYIKDPAKLDDILKRIESVAKDAYK